MYSASHVDNATVDYRFDIQLMGALLSARTTPLTDFLVPGHAA